MRTVTTIAILLGLALLGGCNKANSSSAALPLKAINSPSYTMNSQAGLAAPQTASLQLHYVGFKDGYVRKTAYDTEGNRILVGNPQGALILNPKEYMLLAKQNPAGDELWKVRWGNGSIVQALNLLVDTDGGIYISGTTGDIGDDMDFLLWKYSASGELLWEKAWGNTNIEMLKTLAVDAENNIYAAGSSFARDRSLSGINPIVKFSSNGEVLGGTGITVGTRTSLSGMATIEKNLYVAASFRMSDSRKENGLILGLSNDLALQWGLSLTDEDSITPRFVFETTSGDLLVVGNLFREGPNNTRNIFSILVTKQGEVLSATEYQTAFVDRLKGAFQAADGTIYCYCQRSLLLGKTYDTDFLVIGFDGSGADPTAFTLDNGTKPANPVSMTEILAGRIELFTCEPIEVAAQWQETTLPGTELECEIAEAAVEVEAIEIQTYTPDSKIKRLK